MSGVLPRYKHGPVTYEVSAAVKGGQLIEADSANVGKVRAAQAGSTTVVGVTMTDARPAQSNTGTTADGFPFLDISGLPQHATVDDNMWVAVNYTGNVAFGKALKAGAAGSVLAWVSGTDAADLIVGYCAEPLGVTSGSTALARIIR